MAQSISAHTRVGTNMSEAREGWMPGHAGFDTASYPGDLAMEAFRERYAFSGYYLNSPCHRDEPAGEWTPWMGRWRFLTSLGYGLAVIYVGHQRNGVSPCTATTQSWQQGQADAEDAITQAEKDQLRGDVTIFLDIEGGPPLSSDCMDYCGGWLTTMLSTQYHPGFYSSWRNGDTLITKASEWYQETGHDGRRPACWLYKIDDSFVPESRQPGDTGKAYADIWQGRMNIEETHRHPITGIAYTLRVDQNVATSANPSGVWCPE